MEKGKEKEKEMEKKRDSFLLAMPTVAVNRTGEASNDGGAPSSRPSRPRVQNTSLSVGRLWEDEEQTELVPGGPHHHH